MQTTLLTSIKSNPKNKRNRGFDLDDETTRVQLLIVLYKNENIYVVFASKTNENLFDNFLIHGDISKENLNTETG